MSLGDTIGYFIFGNPFSQALISTASSVVQSIGDLTPRKITAPQVQAPIRHICLPLSKLAGRDYLFVRLAGVSGAFAVIMGAYGKHILAQIADPKDQFEAKTVFETASRFHFLNTFALMAMPLAKKPFLVSNVFFFFKFHTNSTYGVDKQKLVKYAQSCNVFERILL